MSAQDEYQRYLAEKHELRDKLTALEEQERKVARNLVDVKQQIKATKEDLALVAQVVQDAWADVVIEKREKEKRSQNAI